MPSGSSVCATPKRLQTLRHDRQPIAFLDPQFLRAAHDRLALGAGRGDKKHGELIDRQRHEADRDFDAAQLAGLHFEIGNRLTVVGTGTARMHRDPSAHQLQQLQQARTGRVDTHIAQPQPLRRGQTPATRKKAAEEKSAGTSMCVPMSGWPPARVTDAPSRPPDAKGAQHALGVIARRVQAP